MDYKKNHELVQQYVDGTMPADEIVQFELQLKKDPLLQQEYRLLMDIDSEFKNVELKEFKNQLDIVSDNYFHKSDEKKDIPKIVNINIKTLLSIAAGLLLLASVFLWSTNNRKSNSTISYYDFGEIYSDGIRGEANQNSSSSVQKEQLVDLLEKGKSQVVVDLLKNKTIDDASRLLLGHAYLQNALYNKRKINNSILAAIKTVSPLTKSTNLEIKYEAEWILLLSYSESPSHQSNYNDLLKSIITNEDHSFYAKAKEMQIDLEE